jgi:hypothetical protein
VVITSVALGVAVAGYGLAGSYVSIAELAERHRVPLAEFVSMVAWSLWWSSTWC